MLTAYFDESGHSANTDFVSVAAFVAYDTDWVGLEEGWQSALREAGAPYLHMREFAHSRGPFLGWDEGKRRGLLKDCVEAINATSAVAVGAALAVADFRQLNDTEQIGMVDPFYCCFQEAVRGAAIHGMHEADGVAVRMVFSQQDEFGPRAGQLWSVMANSIDVKDRMGSISFDNMQLRPGLQAADLLAYEFRHYYHLLSKRPGTKPRWPFAQIMNHQVNVLGARMLKYLPGWYLKLQASHTYKQAMAALLSTPAGVRFVESECYPHP